MATSIPPILALARLILSPLRRLADPTQGITFTAQVEGLPRRDDYSTLPSIQGEFGGWVYALHYSMLTGGFVARIQGLGWFIGQIGPVPQDWEEGALPHLGTPTHYRVHYRQYRARTEPVDAQMVFQQYADVEALLALSGVYMASEPGGVQLEVLGVTSGLPGSPGPCPAPERSEAAGRRVAAGLLRHHGLRPVVALPEVPAGYRCWRKGTHRGQKYWLFYNVSFQNYALIMEDGGIFLARGYST